jgi:hypothetical protein
MEGRRGATFEAMSLARSAFFGILVLAPTASAQYGGPEFAVNSHTTGRWADTYQGGFPTVSSTSAGAYIVTWVAAEDSFDHFGYSDVFVQRYGAAGAELGAPQCVVSPPNDRRWDVFPTVGMDATGRYVVVWEKKSFPRQIRASLRGADGTPVVPEFIVASDEQRYLRPEVAMDPSGNFVVVWSDGYEVYARRYGSTGAALDAQFRVNAVTTGTQDNPSVALDSAGNFVIAFDTDESGDADVHARRFAWNGSPLGAEFRVNESTAGQGPYPLFPHVSVGPSGGFIVAWSDAVLGAYQGVFARRFSSGGAPQGAQFRVTSSSGYASVSVGTGDAFLVTSLESSEPPRLIARFYSPIGAPLGSELRLDADAWGVPGIPRATAGANGVHLVSWMGGEVTGSSANVRGRLVSALDIPPQPLGDPFRVNATDFSHGTKPKIAESDTGSFVIAWRSETVSARRFSPDGTPIGGEISVPAFLPDLGGVASDAAGDFVLAWRDSSPGVFARRYASDGSPRGDTFRVNTDANALDGIPSVASNGNGDFVVVWSSNVADGDGYGIFGRRYASSGAPLTSEFRVNTATAGSQSSPRVSSNRTGAFAVVWAGPDAGGHDGIFGRLYTAAGTPVAQEFRVSEQTSGVRNEPAVAMSPTGEVLVTWTNGVDAFSGHHIFARRFASDGQPLGGEFRVNDKTAGYLCAQPAVASDRYGRFVVAWQTVDGAGSYKTWAKEYRRDGGAGPELLVEPTAASARSPAVAGAPQIVVAWERPDPSTFFNGDIYARRFTSPLVPSDANGDGALDVADVFYLINHLFAGGPAACFGGDANGDGLLSVVDVFYLINYLFAGGSPPR